MYVWSLFRFLTLWLASTSMAASIASSKVSGPIMVSISTYLGDRELMNLRTTVLIGVLFCGSTRLYIFLKRVVYSDISSSSSCSKTSHFLYQTSTWTLVLNLTTNLGTKLCLWSVPSS